MLTKSRAKRHRKIRSRVYGTKDRPRLCVFRSSENIYVQVIDDDLGHTLTSASTVEKDFASYGGNREAAEKIGEIIGKRCLEKGIQAVVFDRGGYLYHGRVKVLAEKAREAGLKF